MDGLKPNSLCKNELCRRAYYACAYCTHANAWRAVACSPECFNAYMEQVAVARGLGKPVNLLPERTDMDENAVKELMAMPREDVIEMTKEELVDYKEDVAALGIVGTVDKINKRRGKSKK